MRPCEAAYIARYIQSVPAEALSPVLELGSSTAHFRRNLKPHIHQNIHGPLEARGVEVISSDQKGGDGVHISGDVFDPAVQEKLAAVQPRLVLCCNMFEHVTDRQALAQVCDRVLAPGGRLVVSVPHSYPLHQDPIDTYYRPAPEQIAELFPGYALEEAAIVKDGNALADLMQGDVLKNLAVMLRLLIPTRGWAKWKERNHRLLWLLRTYEVSVVCLRKPARPAAQRRAAR